MGALDEVAIYDRVLSADRIAEHYDAGRQGGCEPGRPRGRGHRAAVKAGVDDERATLARTYVSASSPRAGVPLDAART